MKKPSNKIKDTLDHEAERATRWIGSTKSVIVHSVVFAVAFLLPIFGVELEMVLLVLTTVVSLEAIYLAIFIQMSVNKNTYDIEEIQEDVEEIQKDVDEIQEDIEDIEEVQEQDVHVDKQLQQKLDVLNSMQDVLKKLSDEIEQLKKK